MLTFIGQSGDRSCVAGLVCLSLTVFCLSCLPYPLSVFAFSSPLLLAHNGSLLTVCLILSGMYVYLCAWMRVCIYESVYVYAHLYIHPTIFYWVKNYLKPSKTTCGIWHRVQSESNYPCEVLAQYLSYSGSQELPQQPSEGFPELCEGWLPPLVTYCLSNSALQMLTVTGAFSHDLSVRFGLLWSGNSSLGTNVSGTGM